MGFRSRVGKLAKKVIEAPARLTGKAISGVAEFVGEKVGGRVGEIIECMGRDAAFGARLPAELAGTAVASGINAVAGLGSRLVGDTAGAEESFGEMRAEVSETVEDFGAAASNVKKLFQSVTAESVYWKVKREYDELQSENTRQFNELARKRTEVAQRLDVVVKALNEDKKKSKKLFDRFVRVAQAVADWQIASYDAFDTSVTPAVNPAPIKSSADVFAAVDFESNPVWNSLKGLVTLGMLTESQVKDAQVTIINQRRAAQEWWSADQACTEQLVRVCESLDFVHDSFELFIGSYERMIDELEYALALLRVAQNMLDPTSFPNLERVNPYFLPKRHLLVLMACDKLSRLLCEMAKRRYVTATRSSAEIVAADSDCVRNYRNAEFVRMQQELAA